MQTQQMSEIDWPLGWDRTPPGERTRNGRFDTSLNQSIRDLRDELGRVGADDWRLSTGAQHQKRNPNFPYADSNPDDPGAVVRWTADGEQYAAACDAYTSLRDNIRSLFYYVREKRKMSNRPVTTGEDEFSNLRLPAGDEPIAPERPAHVVLGVAPDADESAVKQAFRERVKEVHPDRPDGDREEYARLQDAREEMLRS